MERNTDYDYRNIVCENPTRYFRVVSKLEKMLGYSVKVDRSKTSNSYYLTVKDLNMKIRISDHNRMGFPPYKSVEHKRWWQFWK